MPQILDHADFSTFVRCPSGGKYFKVIGNVKRVSINQVLDDFTTPVVRLGGGCIGSDGASTEQLFALVNTNSAALEDGVITFLGDSSSPASLRMSFMYLGR